jgi:endonuclease/exonuclease/phosphatase family metal-dependent hydrolase
MKLITWNIRKGLGPHHGPKADAEALGRMVASLHPELVLLQEVARREEGAQGDALAESLEMTVHYAANAVTRRGDHGNATFVRRDVHEVSNHDLSLNPIERRGLLHTVLDLNGRKLHVLNTHLSLTGGQRRRQVARIAEVIARDCPADEALVLAGDFNDWTGRLDRLVRETCGVASIAGALTRTERRSWPSFRPLLALDRVYYRGLELADARVLRDAPWRTLSDHLPLEVTFFVP